MHNFLGHDGFVWWIGQVVSIDDPMTLGRCRVRIFGYHGEAKDIPDEDLPWAVSIHPVNTPNLYGTPRVGDFVFGFFLDALAAQEPAMMGYFPYAPPGQTKSFSSVTQKDSVVLDVNGAKIAIDSSGNITLTGNKITLNGQVEMGSVSASSISSDSVSASSISSDSVSASSISSDLISSDSVSASSISSDSVSASSLSTSSFSTDSVNSEESITKSLIITP